MIKFNWLLLIILFLEVGYSGTSYAANCLIRGEWMVSLKSTLGTLVFEQEGGRFWVEPRQFSLCGEQRLEGVTDGVKMSAKAYWTKPEGNSMCKNWIQYDGAFVSPDCSKVDLKITNHTEIGESEMQVKLYRSFIKITKPEAASEMVITAEPKMPDIEVEAMLIRPDSLEFLSSMGLLDTRLPAYTWHISINHDTIPGILSFKTQLDDFVSNMPSYKPNFDSLKDVSHGVNVEGGIMGGEMTISVEHYKTVSDKRTYIIKGTNPGQAAINQVLTDTVSRQIACQESRYRQFKGDREGGIGFPVIGENDHGNEIGGVGIMQLYNPRPCASEVWNWRENIKGGMNKISETLKQATEAHIGERRRLNKDRAAQGLPACPLGIPTKLVPEQITREAIRRYNCGVEYRWEPRDAPNCAGRWVVYHSCDNDINADINYVDNVLFCKL